MVLIWFEKHVLALRLVTDWAHLLIAKVDFFSVGVRILNLFLHDAEPLIKLVVLVVALLEDLRLDHRPEILRAPIQQLLVLCGNLLYYL